MSSSTCGVEDEANAGLVATPLLAFEIATASASAPVVFTEFGGRKVPAAILGRVASDGHGVLQA